MKSMKALFIHDRYVKQVPEMLSFFRFLINFNSMPFMSISEDIFEVSVRLFFSNLTCLVVSEGEKVILKSFFRS